MADATTWAVLKAKAAKGINVLAEITFGLHVTSWSATGGQTITYEAVIAQQPKVHSTIVISGVKVDGETSLTSRASIALVDANPGSFFWDASTNKIYVSMTTGTPITTTTVPEFVLYFSSGSYNKKPIIFNGNLYWPNIVNTAPITRSFSNVAQEQPEVFTEVVLAVDEDWDTLTSLYLPEGREAKLLIGGEALPYSEHQVDFTGNVTSQDPDVENGSWTIALVSKIDQLNVKVPTTVHAQDDALGSIEVDYPYAPGYSITKAYADLDSDAFEKFPVGQAKPIVYGRGVTFPLNLVITDGDDEAIGQVSGHAISRVNWVRVRDRKVTWDTNHIDATSDLKWYVNLTTGHIYIDLVDAELDIDVDEILVNVDGKVDSNGDVIENPADIIDDLLTSHGLTGLEATSLTTSRFLGSLYEMAFAITTQEPLGRIIQEICNQTGGRFYENAAGEYLYTIYAPDLRSAVEIDEKVGDYLDYDPSQVSDQLWYEMTVEFGEFTEAGQDASVALSTTHTRSEVRAQANISKTDVHLANWLKTEAGAVILAARMIRFAGHKPVLSRIASTLTHFNTDVMTAVKFSKTRQVQENTSYTMYGLVMERSADLDECVVDLLVDDARVIPRGAWIGASGAAAEGSATADEKRYTGYLANDDETIDLTDNQTYRYTLEW